MNIILFIAGGGETNLSEVVIPAELFSDNLTNTSSGTPTRLPVLAEEGRSRILEKRVRLGAAIEVGEFLYILS